MIDYSDQITQAQFAVEDKIGKVMSSGAQILAIKQRASNFLSTSNKTVNDQAAAIVAKCNGLISNLNQIQGDAATLGQKANAMLAQIQSDPTWQAIQNSPSFFDYAGFAVKAVANNNIGQATSLAQQLSGLASRADAHLQQVDELSGDESNMEDYAQGKGFAATVASLGGSVSGAVTSYTGMIKYGAIAVGLFFVWDLAKPFVAARQAVHRNPRRRIRRYSRRRR
ncbi:MAG TPA: hypothetical protein VN915_06750 [Elusimicrobiota bacterium]|nr:hypothetical protein [Elusimicrobiota bacterium]